MIAGIVAQQGVQAEVAPAPSPHLYWRLRFTQITGGGDVYSVAELNFLDDDGNNLEGDGSPFASSRYSNSATYGADKAFDGNNSTFWASANNSEQHLGYHFTSPVTVTSFIVRSRSGYNSQTPSAFYLEHSDDGIEWNIAGEYVGQQAWSATVPRTFTTQPAVAGKFYFWRVYVTENNGGGSHAINEMEFYNGSVDITSSDRLRAIASSNTYSDFPAYQAFDGVIASGSGGCWATDLSVAAWLGQMLAEPANVDRVTIWARSSGYNNQMPKAFKIQASNNPLSGTWTDIWSVSDQTGWTPLTPRTFNRP